MLKIYVGDVKNFMLNNWVDMTKKCQVKFI